MVGAEDRTYSPLTTGAADGEIVGEAVVGEVALAEAEALLVGLAEGEGDGLSGLLRTFHAVFSRFLRVNCG